METLKVQCAVSCILNMLIIMFPQLTECNNGGVLQFEDILPADPSTYDKMRPPKKEGKPTVVYFHVTVMSIDSINENSMTFAADIFFAQSWKDYRLRLPENMTSDYRLLELDWLGQMWRPDSYFKNAKQVTFQTMTIPNHYVWLYQSKSLLYMVKLTLTLSCAMNYAIYPHDTQECKLQMESLSHTTEDLVFEWDPDVPLVVDENIELPQFDLVKNFTADCSQEYSTGNFTCLEVVFQLKRRLGYYLFHTYMPTCLIVIMSWISFWIKPEAAPARVTLGVTSLLTLSTQHAKSQASLPPVSYIKIIDMFMSTCTIFVFLALMEYALVNVVLGDGPEGVSPPAKSSKAATRKSTCFIPMIISDVKKRCKKRTSAVVQALSYSTAEPNIQKEVVEEETKFHSSDINTVLTTAHIRSPHSITCASDSQCLHSPYSVRGGGDLYSVQQSAPSSSHACNHIECQIDRHIIPVTHHCSEPPCYSVHPPEPCCEGHVSSHQYCAAPFPSCSHVMNPHSCPSTYYCLSQPFAERRSSVSHCSSYCEPIGERHRTGSHSGFFDQSYYRENEPAADAADHSCMISRQPCAAAVAHPCNSHSCSRKSRNFSSERRSRSVERTSERHSARAKRISSKSTERLSNEMKWKSSEWRNDAEEKETDESVQPQNVIISCESSNSNATNEEQSTSKRKVPTPPPPPNKPAGLTLAQKRRARAIMVDRFSRVFFPSTFGLMNAVYWIIFWICL